MLRSHFETLVTTETIGGIRWVGFSKNGTLAYGIAYYNGQQNVKVHRASVFGSVHEIAEIEFSYAGWKTEMFYTQRQEIVWIHPVDNNLIKVLSLPLPLISSLIIFNVENRKLTRYYSEENITTNIRFMRAIDDVMVLWRYTSNDEIHLFEIQLDPVHETFSMDFLVRLEYNDNDQNFEWFTYQSFCYYRGCLVYCGRDDFKYLYFYNFRGRYWHWTSVNMECEPPNAQEEELWRMFDGRSFYYIAKGTDRIRQLRLDYFTLTWKEIFADTQLPLEPDHYFAPQWLAACDGQTICSFSTKWMTTAEPAETLRICVLSEKKSLKELCLHAFWPHIHEMYPELQIFNDHELWEILTLSSVLCANDYFGRDFAQSL